VSDRLYLSCWVRGFSESNMLRHYGKLLETFPFSKLSQRERTLRVYAIEFVEPPLAERAFVPDASISDVISAAREFMQPDCACDLEAAWDLWQRETGEWEVRPSPVTLSCFGPQFENEAGDHLRIDFGLDAIFLPAPDVEGSLRMHESNLRSLLHLVSEIEAALPLERKHLWSESGANFAELLSQAVSRFGPN
jgi:hypothetical protein